MKNKNQKKEMGVEEIKSLLRGMMVTSPTPWTIQEKTGDIIDNNGRFVARVGWGIEKFKHPVDQNNREFILKAVEFYVKHRNDENKDGKIEKRILPENVSPTQEDLTTSVSNIGGGVTLPASSDYEEPTALAYTKMTEDGIEDVEPAIHATDEMRVNFLKNQLKVENDDELR